ncbi:hypothetical protein BVRB_6g149500 [Beta vulgaris subsp. vulgaris]|nr:hypothetical protein BVRB_6g149500 [Beta vulgaris subsp. vulgaris]
MAELLAILEGLQFAHKGVAKEVSNFPVRIREAGA